MQIYFKIDKRVILNSYNQALVFDQRRKVNESKIFYLKYRLIKKLYI